MFNRNSNTIEVFVACYEKEMKWHKFRDYLFPSLTRTPQVFLTEDDAMRLTPNHVSVAKYVKIRIAKSSLDMAALMTTGTSPILVADAHVRKSSHHHYPQRTLQTS